ncbi:efflux RND transporter periplasmic adaptor subunit [Lutimaribacter sp. EGI FJ00015]|uniref:Efflux RND transporter periplasmic adaptor subunit n=1 Tax=Lutimaribacter degradans TaxID=2945989 RepID=A0ACC5ZZ70_9RHOB|nr:efflux RND transporter periplasmic adaptor subunit [Lutimaribacter sp. EGI FJ00013]MCM2563663.1 efflux RND transporter periplasmic adaptor subunit [Lutimaribacter sp. EGI FJ00013]MCO0614801.1 efflux RND transporter periplasmic adaptor subunit [Lutimaribacter sp. EGI FJ00015]MCO0637515.1 efflux RND transporter periplasmic adaptor subunit [Lutimaribacter sp. EGI FJ00014]
MKQVFLLVLSLGLAMPAHAQQADVPRPAKLMTLAEDDSTVSRQFYGRVRARATVDLAFQVSGQITEFAVSEGERLARGGVIAQLDQRSYQRSLRQAEVNLDKAHRDLERLEQLSSDNVPEVQIKDAETNVNLAQIAVEQAKEQLEDATLAAPYDALVARREVANFSTVSAGQPVVRLHDMSEMRVDIDVPEVLFRRLGGAERKFEIHASFPGDETRYPLVIREYEAETAEVAQTFRVTLAFVDEVGDGILPGSATTVTVATAGARGSALTVPETALVFDPNSTPAVFVYAPEGDNSDIGTVSSVPVEIELREDGSLVLVDGPPPGTEIVATGASLLEDGQLVRRFTGIGE